MRRLILCAALVGLAGCSTATRVKTEKAVATALVSDADEDALGVQVHQELERQGVKYVTDPVITSYVEGVANRLMPYAKKDRNTHWHVHVIDDPKTVNAFATPGGHIYVFTGLLTSADNEAEVAGVLSHEIGHVVARHAARQMVQVYGLETVAGIALGKNPNMLKKVGASIAANGVLLAHSRADENEADEYAVKYSSMAGYDPHGIATFFTKLMSKEGKTPKVLTWLSTHPATTDRIVHVNEVIAEDHLTGSDIGAERLAPIKARIPSVSGTPVSSR
jgi:predicted Zn-dependent protease